MLFIARAGESLEVTEVREMIEAKKSRRKMGFRLEGTRLAMQGQGESDE